MAECLKDPKEALPEGKSAALAALKVDDTLAEAHAVLGSIQGTADFDWVGAEREFRRAAEPNPGGSRCAVAQTRAAGIVRRDLKPTNIMVNEDGVVKVLDFGLAKLMGQIQGDETLSTAAVADKGKPITERAGS